MFNLLSSSDEKLTMNIGRYQLLEEIGRGSMGIVYKAKDPNLDLTVALKVLRRDRLYNEAIVRRFISEARALGRLDHPNIVRVFNVDRDGDDVYIAMEFIEGDSFSSLISSKNCPMELVAELGATIAEALDYAHKRGVIHRDVKPSNIIFTNNGRLKITDFGIAHIEDSGFEETQAGEILGTPAYMSPEQVLSQPVDGRSDLFSLGIILYEMTTGTRPFTGQGMKAIFNAITSENPLPVLTRSPQTPKALADVIMKSLNKSPGSRCVDGIEMASLLREAVGKEQAVSAEFGNKPASIPRKNLIMFIAVTALLVVSGLIFYSYSARVTRAPVPIKPENKSLQAAPVAENSGQAVLDAVTTPAGAQVVLDGVPLGISPARISATSGKHEIRLVLMGYEEWAAQVELEKNGITPLAVELIPKK